MARPQIPRLADLAAPAIDTLVAQRPNAARHIAQGRYGDVIHGWLAQAALCRARLADEVASARLGLAESDALRELAASEFWASLPAAPQSAVGEAVLRRDVMNLLTTPTGQFAPGVIPSGSKFRRAGDAAADPPEEEAQYQSTEAVYVDADDTEAPVALGGGSYRHRQTITVPVEATRPGPHANTPVFELYDPALPGELLFTPFDTTLEVVSLRAAGGSTGAVEDHIRALAQASSFGLLGPTRTALIAGALSHAGVRRVVAVEDESDAVTKLYIADPSWAYSDRLAEAVMRRLRGEDGGIGWLGFGARVAFRGVKNQRVIVEADVVLRNSDYEASQETITAGLTKKVQSYLDDRPDWWAWQLTGLGGLLSAADRRILTCTSVQLLDEDGDALAEPAASIDPASALLTHYHLSSSAMRINYSSPS